MPDPVFGSTLISRIINRLMTRGKKSVARRLLYEALELVAERSRRDPLEVLEQGFRNIMPVLEARPRRVGGQTYQVPLEVRPTRKVTLSIRWLVDAARRRPGKSMAQKLAAELLDAAGGTGAAVKRREDTHRMAEANRAFAHYRW